ncbi:MAG: hypothetical protein AAFO75_00775, partial [Pseudomonadota bacterium]
MLAALVDFEGAWSESLTYRNYQSNEPVEIHHGRIMSSAEDGCYVSAHLSFNDPGRQVYAGEVITVSNDKVVLGSVGRGCLDQDMLRVESFTVTGGGWAATLFGQTFDNGEPAEAKFLRQLHNDHLTLVKSVR